MLTDQSLASILKELLCSAHPASMEESSATVAKSLNSTIPISTRIVHPNVSFLQKNNHNIDVSFSSHLKPMEAKSQVEDTEISIFDAYKYFNESSVNEGNKESPFNSLSLARYSSASSADASFYSKNNKYRGRSFRATPTASSEASWNSQTGLLSNPRGANGVSIRDQGDQKKRGPATKWRFFRRKCPCSGKKSVQVQKNISPPAEPKIKNSDISSVQVSISSNSLTHQKNQPIMGIHCTKSAQQKKLISPSTIVVGGRNFDTATKDRGGSGFSFPILTPQSSALTKIAAGGMSSLQDPSRHSLEVFRPAGQNRSSLVFPTIPIGTVDEETASDVSSSDLFEIESFSTQTSSYPNPSRVIHKDSVDDTMTESTEYCYEPSEASVVWSVATAEPANDVTVVMTSGGDGGGGGRRRSSGGNGLFNCRCEKAVMVREGPHRAAKSVTLPTLPPLARPRLFLP